MKKTIAILLTLFCIISCRNDRRESIQFRINYINGNIDTTELNLLNKSYQSDDTIALSLFFSDWYNKSQNLQSLPQNETEKALYNIFNEIYHPFQLEKYGWLPRSHYNQYNYAILNTAIAYKTLDHLDSLSGCNKLILDTLQPFLPTPDLLKVKVLYDIDPFKSTLEKFLELDSFNKRFFLERIINMPISRNKKEYRTSPEIYYILLNKKLDCAIADIRLISTGIRINLKKLNNRWTIIQTKQLWIE